MDKQTIAIYDAYAAEFEKKAKDYLKNYILADAELFLEKLQGKEILDIGSGAGRDALFFKEKCFSPVCVDLSKAMVALCKKKGLTAYQMDMEQLAFENNIFDGVWAYTSLVHLHKNKIESVIKKIAQLLKKEGVFYIGMKEGDFEGYLENKDYKQQKMFYSFYTKKELKVLLLRFFTIIHFSRVEMDHGSVYLNFLCMKK
ncbi:class I SAM-dependent methyltransferase [Candidatus Woesearchaeota archaeon]|nr:class I SAM-dependent methyltransferase [Candidatus Woesearchaeota archaeon]